MCKSHVKCTFLGLFFQCNTFTLFNDPDDVIKWVSTLTSMLQQLVWPSFPVQFHRVDIGILHCLYIGIVTQSRHNPT